MHRLPKHATAATVGIVDTIADMGEGGTGGAAGEDGEAAAVGWGPGFCFYIHGVALLRALGPGEPTGRSDP